MAENIALSSATIQGTNGTASFSITTPPSFKVKATGSGVLRGPISVVITGATIPGCAGASGVGTINPTAIKVKADGQFVIRENDIGTAVVSNPSVPCSGTLNFKITNAGQSKVKAN